ncbi:MAG: zinc ribbon domain-containing protein [Anaerolineae bacterium]|jgi:putative FmdB family regulatory protein|nr:zinc ribbon domain-containing protein [Anaerolineae bacterium]MBT7071321.1 zinc ribbon domain-containing protein [Anaerolineae bacterium]MBT7324161.1 zinc ribbon domain-containing protein [Anaerolineae bacterium]
MPVYTYRCESCGIEFDYQQKFNDANLSVCPECDDKSLHRVYRPVGIVFKGSGFYATDNRSPSGLKERNQKEGTDTNKEEKTEKTEKKDTEKKSAEPAKKESKSETKKD